MIPSAIAKAYKGQYSCGACRAIRHTLNPPLCFMETAIENISGGLEIEPHKHPYRDWKLLGKFCKWSLSGKKLYMVTAYFCSRWSLETLEVGMEPIGSSLVFSVCGGILTCGSMGAAGLSEPELLIQLLEVKTVITIHHCLYNCACNTAGKACGLPLLYPKLYYMAYLCVHSLSLPRISVDKDSCF